MEEVVVVHTNNRGRRQGQGDTVTASNDDNGVCDGASAMKGAGMRQSTTYVDVNVDVDDARMISARKGGGEGGGERSSNTHHDNQMTRPPALPPLSSHGSASHKG